MRGKTPNPNHFLTCIQKPLFLPIFESTINLLLLSLNSKWLRDIIYIASKQLQYKCGDAAVDSYQYVNAGQNHVGRAGDLKEERGGVHQRGDGPSAKEIISDEKRLEQ